MTERTTYGHLNKAQLTRRLIEALKRNAKQRATIQRLRYRLSEASEK